MKIRSQLMTNLKKLDEQFTFGFITEKQYGIYANMFLLDELAVLTSKRQIKVSETGYELVSRLKKEA